MKIPVDNGRRPLREVGKSLVHPIYTLTMKAAALLVVSVAANAQGQWQILLPDEAGGRIGPIEPLRLSAAGLDQTTTETAARALALRRVEAPFGNIPIHVKVTGSGEVVLTPRVPLARDTRYAVVMPDTGDNDTGGAVIGEFLTVANRLIRQEYFRSGVRSHFQELHYDSAQRLLRREEYRSIAGQGDQLVAVVMVGDRERGRQETYLTDPGADTRWGTSDDRVASYARADVDGEGRPVLDITAYSPGRDGVWFNADDAALGYIRYEYAADGNLQREIHYGDAGNDGVSLTADDAVLWYDAHQYTKGRDGNPSFRFDAPGRDGKWFTDDDAVQAVAATLSEGKVRAQFDSPGSDGVWLTADDRLRDYRRTLEDPGQLTYIQYDGPGVDGKWLNDDDRVRHYSRYESNALGIRTRHMLFGSAGKDGVWLSEDDEPESYILYRSDGRGVAISQTRYTGPGRDTAWFTEDDTVGHYERYEMAANGSRVSITQLVAPGTDGVWFTADDVPGQQSFFDPSR